jgi:hypothetical protein
MATDDRRAQESASLEATIQTMLSGAKSKNDRKRINQRAEQMRRDLYARQQDELDDPSADPPPPTPTPPTPTPPPPAADPKADRREQNREKRLKKAQQKYKLESALPLHTKTRGVIEAEQLDAQLAKLGLKMRPVLGDGHCLYRAIAFGLPDVGEFQTVRRRIADELRGHTEKYFDFSGCQDADQYAAHCDTVERTAEWGDELEIAAAANAFRVAFVVHENGAEPKTWGDFALRTNLALLRHYTTSGGHYNPIIPL